MTQSPSNAPRFARATFCSPLCFPRVARVPLLSPASPGSSHKFNAKVKTSTTRSRVGRDTRSLREEAACVACVECVRVFARAFSSVCYLLLLLVSLVAVVICRFIERIVRVQLFPSRVSRALFQPVFLF